MTSEINLFIRPKGFSIQDLIIIKTKTKTNKQQMNVYSKLRHPPVV